MAGKKKTTTTTTTTTVVTTTTGESTKPVEIIAVIDRSGSMGSMAVEAIGAYNAFIEEQRKLDDNANLTVVLFDNQYEILQHRVKITDAIKLDNKNFVPRGSTALNDAIGRTLQTFKELRNTGTFEGAIFTVLTDGEENASQEYTDATLRPLIEQAEKEYDWKFVYLAANQNAVRVGMQKGFRSNVNYAATGAGIRSAVATLSASTSEYRMTKAAGLSAYENVTTDADKVDDLK